LDVDYDDLYDQEQDQALPTHYLELYVFTINI